MSNYVLAWGKRVQDIERGFRGSIEVTKRKESVYDKLSARCSVKPQNSVFKPTKKKGMAETDYYVNERENFYMAGDCKRLVCVSQDICMQ